MTTEQVEKKKGPEIPTTPPVGAEAGPRTNATTGREEQ